MGAAMVADQANLDEIASTHGRMVELAIRSGEKSKAHAAVERAFGARASLDFRLHINDPITLIIRPRIATILEGSGIKTIGDLCSHSRTSLAEIHQIRYRSVDLIELALRDNGYSLRCDA